MISQGPGRHASSRVHCSAQRPAAPSIPPPIPSCLRRELVSTFSSLDQYGVQAVAASGRERRWNAERTVILAARSRCGHPYRLHAKLARRCATQHGTTVLCGTGPLVPWRTVCCGALVARQRGNACHCAAVEVSEEERRRLRNRKKREGRERRFREQPPDETGMHAVASAALPTSGSARNGCAVLSAL